MPVDEDLVRRGQALAQRRLRHGIRTAVDLAAQAGMDRRTIARIEAGEAAASSASALEAFFDELDVQKGMDTRAPEEAHELIEFDITGPTTMWHVVVRGPMESADEVRHQAAQLLRDIDPGGAPPA